MSTVSTDALWFLVALLCLAALWLLTLPLTGFPPRCAQFAWSRLLRCRKKPKPFTSTLIYENPGGAPLLLGSKPRSQDDVKRLLDAHQGKLAILSLNAAWELEVYESQLRELGVTFLRLPTPDYFQPSQAAIRAGVAFTEEHITKGNAVFIHCNAGKGRSAVVVLCVLMKKFGWSAMEAYAHVAKLRKLARFLILCGSRPQWRAVLQFEQYLRKHRPESEQWAWPPSHVEDGGMSSKVIKVSAATK